MLILREVPQYGLLRSAKLLVMPKHWIDNTSVLLFGQSVTEEGSNG